MDTQFDNSTITFDATASSKIFLSNLNVRADLFGKTHSFQFKGHDVRVSIPEIKINQNLETQPEDPARRCTWREIDGKIVDAWYEVDYVIVDVDLREKITAPANIFDIQYNAFDLLGKDKSALNNSLADEYHIIIYDVFNYWARTVRWITRSDGLDAPDWKAVRNEKQIDSAYLLRKCDRKKYWAKGGIYVVQYPTYLNHEAWRSVGKTLISGEVSPIWFDYLFDAQHRVRIQDIEASIISCAIACETLIRAVFWSCVPSVSHEAFVEIVDNVNVRSIANKWIKLPMGEKLPDEVHEIFNLRNKIMHDGQARSIKMEDLKNLLKHTEKFIRKTDEKYRHLKNLPERYVDVAR